MTTTPTSSAPSARRIDVTRLPAEVVELIDALRPGEDLVITRDGDGIATISRTWGVVGDAASEPGTSDEASESAAMDYGNVTVVATAMKLSAAARTSLSSELGEDYIVLDMHSAPATADVVLVPPVSPQLIGNVRSMFPKPVSSSPRSRTPSSG